MGKSVVDRVIFVVIAFKPGKKATTVITVAIVKDIAVAIVTKGIAMAVANVATIETVFGIGSVCPFEYRITAVKKVEEIFVVAVVKV